MLQRLLRHLNRAAKARRFGIPFHRRASFALPPAVRIGGRMMPVASLPEHGAAVDFLTCFIEDDYGLADIDFPVRTIADIGANLGFFSMAARSYFPAATIHAYEPNPRVSPCLSRNAAATGFEVFAEAVGATAGLVSIEDGADSNQVRTIAATGSGARIAQVSLATVVSRMGGVIDLAKIDCEGAEWDLFRDERSWARIRHVRMEYHLWGRHAVAEVSQAFDRVGFTVSCHKPAGEWGTIWADNVKA
jgi:FkbM family methyltransferase